MTKTATAPRKGARTAKDTATEPGGQADEVYARIDRKREVLGRIAEIKADLSAVSTRRAHLEAELRQARDAARGYQSSNPSVHERYARLRADAERKMEELRDALADVEAHHEAAKEELGRLEAEELPACQGDTGLDTVLEHQHRVEVKRAEVARLEAAIEARAEEAEGALAEVPTLDALYTRREDLLAEIEVGGATEADLADLDAEIERQREEAEEAGDLADRRAEAARQAAAGLERKLATAREALADLEGRTPEVLERFLIGEAEIACAEYVNAAIKVKERFIQLHAVDQLIRRINGQHRALLTHGWHQAKLPTFLLPQCEGLEPSNHPGTLFSAELLGYGDTFQRALEAERARLAGLGVGGL